MCHGQNIVFIFDVGSGHPIINYWESKPNGLIMVNLNPYENELMIPIL